MSRPRHAMLPVPAPRPLPIPEESAPEHDAKHRFPVGYFYDYRAPRGTGIEIVQLRQPGGVYEDLPNSQLFLGYVMSARTEADTEFGSRRFHFNEATGNLFFGPSHVPTRTQVHGDHRVVMLRMEEREVRALLGHQPTGEPLDFGYLHTMGFRDAFAQAALIRLWQEATMPGGHDALLMQSIAASLFANLYSRSQRVGVRPHRGGMAPYLVKLVQERLAERLDETITLAELSALTGLSPFHLCRAFKDTVGETPQRWRLLHRLALARHLLQTTTEPITVIAQMTGYDSSQSLARVFNREVGCSPSAYRQAWSR